MYRLTLCCPACALLENVVVFSGLDGIMLFNSSSSELGRSPIFGFIGSLFSSSDFIIASWGWPCIDGDTNLLRDFLLVDVGPDEAAQSPLRKLLLVSAPRDFTKLFSFSEGDGFRLDFDAIELT